MSDGSTEHQRMTAGLDLGDKYTYLCLIDTENGEVIEEGRLRTTPQALRRRFDSEQEQLKIAIEVGTHSPWVSRLLKECGHEVLVANARKIRLIYGSGRKSDKLDAQKLARLARLDPELLYPIEHRGEDSQAHLALIHSREALVRSRTQLINHVRGTVKSFGARLPKCSAQSFHKKVTESLPAQLKETLQPVVATIASLTEKIRDYDRRIKELNAWCELSARNLRGRHPRSKVGLLPDPEGKGTNSWSMWTPSSPHFMSWLTTFAIPSRRKSVRVLRPPSARASSSP